ncbi:unnamed protein product [Diamesa tonsa]
MQFEKLRNNYLNRPTGVRVGSAVVITALITYLECQPFTIIVSSIYFTWVYRSFYSNYKLHISKELTDKIKMLYDNLKTLRSTRPNVFCGFVSSFLFLVAIFGHYVSGRWIVLLCLVSAALFTSIYRVEIIKEKDSTPSSIYDGEFEPLIDDSEREMLNRIGDDADDTAVYSKNNNTMSDNDSDDSELEALLPTIHGNLLDADDVDNDDDEINPLLTQSAEYKRKHFNATSSDSNDSSSSTDDDSITRGLDFQILNNNPEPAQPSIASSLLTNCQNTLAKTLIDGINQQRNKTIAKPSRSVESSDSDSEFEILDDKDLVHYKP